MVNTDKPSDLFDVLPEDTAQALVDFGFPTRQSVVEATYKELYPCPGLRKEDVLKVKELCRDEFDRALDPFIPVGKAYANTYEKDYPRKAVALNFNENKITVGDFIALYHAIKNRENN